MFKILIADDHAIVREGIKKILSEFSDIKVVNEAKTGKETIEKVRKEKLDLIILDISLPDRNGLDVLKQIKELKPNLPVLILSIHPEENYAIRTLKAGASGYLTKDKTPHELIKAVKKIFKGGKYITPSLAEKLAYELSRKNEKPLHENLSDREYQVLCMIASGKTIKKIAEELCLSEKTISTYRMRILEKMKMKNNAELIHYAIKHGLIK
ncbi:response regulator transcription factor [SCandidatus Aminicenantes bacterium Aminicenantia_JdfR_composite]|jgi:DNA-binding NarL/FixJ family response regulator|nr:response regulator transcription factor [SCandidatus Aminicenantes bacterium Aminicenantia_JdfR_composite]MCP2596791.1 response regulator transcription factor [Candidatus Aminicenantes bacterium AC-335-G13]MCP2605577.1 response regulator transcription factor [Candidatus Aminicenantes bacterium AC-335-O07]